MLFNAHPHIRDRHAFLSPSTYHWLNYTDQKLEARWHTVSAARRGTDLHALAHEAIRLRVYLDSEHEALADYVSDAIEFDMVCEQPLYYSENCFGTPDTMSFSDELLRIHDLKTGITKASERQLEVYAGIFCLEYGYEPDEIDFELRIYQRDEIRIFETPPSAIETIMEKIVYFDNQINQIREM